MSAILKKAADEGVPAFASHADADRWAAAQPDIPYHSLSAHHASRMSGAGPGAAGYKRRRSRSRSPDEGRRKAYNSDGDDDFPSRKRATGQRGSSRSRSRSRSPAAGHRGDGRRDTAEALPESHTIDHTDVLPRPRGLLVLPLYGALPQEAQQRVFIPTPPGVRKVVVCTNVAETAITVNGVRFVVDPGVVKQKVDYSMQLTMTLTVSYDLLLNVQAYDPAKGVDSLSIVPISKTAAAQRAGRAGRTSPGKCFRLYTRETFADMADETVPEVSGHRSWRALRAAFSSAACRRSSAPTWPTRCCI